MHPTTPYDEICLSTLDFWAQPGAERERRFAILRRERPVSWQPPAEGRLLEDDTDPGYWAVVRHADVAEVSRNADVFVSRLGVNFENMPEQIVAGVSSLLGLDGARHLKLRRLISSAFTPRQVARTEAQIRRQAGLIVDDLLETGDCDFVAQVAKRLPMWTISEMVGVPDDARDAVTTAAEDLSGWNDPQIRRGREPLQVMLDSFLALTGAALELAEARRRHPKDDLMTALVQAEVDSSRLTDDEIGAFFALLAAGGNDTSRNSIACGMKALCDFPDQRARLMEDFEARIGTAVEEMVRWTTPVMAFRRTAVAHIELGGQAICAGDKVVMFYSSANHDERVFPDPHLFDVTRHPNPHLGFGGGGPHYCLGAALARTQIRALFTELLHRAPRLEVGEPVFAVANMIRSVVTLPCRIAP